MSTELTRLFEEGAQKNPPEKYIRVHADMQPPPEVQFSVHSFGDERDLSRSARDAWDWVGGVDAFYSATLIGHVLEPGSIAATMCRVEINPLSSSDSFEMARNGRIGYGWLDSDKLLIRLWLARDATRDLLDFLFRYRPSFEKNDLGATASMFTAQQGKSDWTRPAHRFDLLRQLSLEGVGHDDRLVHMRFDLTDVKEAGGMGKVVSAFNVVRLYM